MISLQRLTPILATLDAALGALLDGVEAVPALELAFAEALNCIAAESAPGKARPPRDVASADGFAFCAHDLVGASSYAPLPLLSPPVWVEAGEAMPDGCDCVIDADSVETSGTTAHVISEAAPGQGVRRAGSDIADGGVVAVAGRRVLPHHLLVAGAAGLTTMRVRRPRLRIVNIPGGTLTADLIAASARHAGAEVDAVAAAGRDAASIAEALQEGGCDLLVTIGGSGVGRADATVLALAARGEVKIHGIALQPCRTVAIGRVGKTPVLVLPGTPAEAAAAWWALALPALDRLSGRLPRDRVRLPLERKISSSVGIAEVVLLERKDDSWVALAIGELSLQSIARAQAWLIVPAGSEGFAAGAMVDACVLRE